MDVLKVGALPLAELRDELNETCFLAVWGNQGATVVHIEPAVRAVTVVTNWARCCRYSALRQGWYLAPTCRNARPRICACRNCTVPLHHVLADDQAYAAQCEQIRARGLHHVHGLLHARGGCLVGTGVQRDRAEWLPC